MSRVSSYGAIVRSIQHNSTTLNNSTSNTTTVTAVDPTRCVILPRTSLQATGGSLPTTLEITNATTVTLSCGSSTTHTVAWSLVEFY